jgi:hypothetical protein
MRQFLKSVSVIAAANFLCFWIVYGLLTAAMPRIGLLQFLGFAPSPPPSHWQVLLVWAFIILSAPGSILLDGAGGDHFISLLILCSVLNCIFWGVCLGGLVYAIRRRVRQAAASPA